MRLTVKNYKNKNKVKFRFQFGRRLSSVAQDQSGVVSTYVSMGIIAILSLISISFALLMQTEYTQARDRQFNTQARVAAEAAINDARQLVYKAIGNRLNLSQFISQHDTCGPSGTPDGAVDASDNDLGSGSICEFMTKWDSNSDGIVYDVECYGFITPERPYYCAQADPDFNSYNLYPLSAGSPYAPGLACGTPPMCESVDIRDLQISSSGTLSISQFQFYDADNDGRVGIEDDILQKPYDTLLIEEWYDCGGGPTVNQADGFEGDLDDAGSNIEYTCVEVDGRPVKLVYDEINTNRSENVLIQTRLLSGGAFSKSNVDKLTINWQGLIAPNFNNFQDAATHEQRLTPEDSWSGQAPAPMLRIQIIPLNIRGGWTRSELNESTRTYYLYPTKYSDGPSINSDAQISLYSSPTTDNNRIVNADCDRDGGERACVVEILGFNGSVGSYQINNAKDDIGNKSETTPANDEMVYIILVRPIYGEADVAISAENSDGDSLRFVNQQINITSTGRAGGLTYRIREVIPIRPKYNRPEYAIDSAEHICKVLIGEPDKGVSYDHDRISGSYSNPVVASLNLPADISFCEELHP